MSPSRKIEDYRTLPATIFYHYFREIPPTAGRYEELLQELERRNIFLIDILDEPLRIRDRRSPTRVNEENLEKLIESIPRLRDKMKRLNIDISDDKIIFLLARKDYKKDLELEFPRSEFVDWKTFRMG